MKLQTFLLTLVFTSSAMADTVKKWVDADGNVHYGDKKSSEYIEKTETLKINNTFDPQLYREGVERHKETEEFANKLEQERLEEERKRKLDEVKEHSHPPPSGGTVVINPPIIRPGYSRPPVRPGPGRPPRPVHPKQ